MNIHAPFFRKHKDRAGWRPWVLLRMVLVLPFALSGSPLAHAGSTPQHLPQRNLLVSWRMQSDAEASRDTAGLQRGAVVVGTDGGLRGRGVITYGSAQAQARGEGEMQVLVLNGAQARLSLGQQRPYTQWQWAYALAPATATSASTSTASGASGTTPASTGSGAIPQSVQAPTFNGQPYTPTLQAYSTTTWVDTGQGVSVRPRWPGGQAPVTLELDTRSELPAPGRAWVSGGSEAPPPQLQAQSTLQVPLGQWVAVARTGGQQSQSQRGSYGTAEVAQGGHTVLEIKVSLP